MDKAPEAFRTISEVAELLETPAHVLRFWETRFPQIKPVKRAGGRRYYRPVDVALLSGIRHLLHGDGMTIRGVQKVLRDHGVRHVAGLSGDISDLDLDADDFEGGDLPEATPTSGAQILSLGTVQRRPVDPDGETARGTIQPLFKPDPDAILRDASEAAPACPDTDPTTTAKRPSAEVPRDGAGGFIAFSNPAPPRAKAPPSTTHAQATLPFDDAPEAPHAWVEAEPPLANVTPHPSSAPAAKLQPAIKAAPSGQDVPQMPDAAEAHTAAPDAAPDLTDAFAPEERAPVKNVTGSIASDTDLSDATNASAIAAPDLSAPARPKDSNPPVPDHNAPDDACPNPLESHQPDPTPNLNGIAHRLRALKVPPTPASAEALAELHPRLGLLHAQMAEALRLRR